MNARRFAFLSMVVVVLSGCTLPAEVYGLRPEYPTADLDITVDITGVGASTPKVAFIEVDTLQPTLRWEPFPDADARKADRDGRLNRIRDVTYDLRILGAENEHPTVVFYARSELPEPVAPGGNAAYARSEVLLDGTGPVHARRAHPGNTVGPDSCERLERCRRAESLLLRFEDPGEVTEVLL